MPFIPVAKIEEIPPGTAKCIETSVAEIALFRLGDEFYAISNICPHQGGPLSEGKVDGDCVTCPWHSWRFNIKDGTYPVRCEGDQVLVSIPE
jgi:nitrite reductase/ring-hydroxylating ferredoxin subunit